MALLIMFAFNLVALLYLVATGDKRNIESRIEREENILQHEHRKYASRFDRIHYFWVMNALKKGKSKEYIEKQVDEIDKSI